jgi:peptide-methionine (S)-S-oxide reductase
VAGITNPRRWFISLQKHRLEHPAIAGVRNSSVQGITMKNLIIVLSIFAVGLLVLACRGGLADSATTQPANDGWALTPQAAKDLKETDMKTEPKTEEATFAAGCFWGVESTFRKVPGVIRTRVGYTGGSTTNPTYRDVCTDRTGHAEAIDIQFDPQKVSYQDLLNIFFENHDPTTVDQQGPDFGTQYRSAIFFHSPEQEKLAEAEKAKRNASGDYVGPIATEIVAAGEFYSAEEYHQRYYEKQGASWSCHFGNGKKAGK